MKRLKVYDSTAEDRLRLTFDGGFDHQSPWHEELEPFFRALEQDADGWMPDVVKGKRQRQYSRANLWKTLEEQRDDTCTHLGLYRTTWPALDMSFWIWLSPRPSRLDVAVNVNPISFFTGEERCRQFVDMVRAWASRYTVAHSIAHSADDMNLADFPSFGRDDETRQRDGFDQIYEVCWLNVFGPRLVETVGRERMLSTPAHRVEALPNGGVLLVTWPTLADFASPQAREAQARAHVHLRPDLDFSTVLRTLLERSSHLAAVEPHFHPDLAPLLSRVVDLAPSHQRQRRIAQLNAWQPPEPTEWLPAEQSLPSDEQDPQRVMALFDRLSERLVALLHSDVPSVLEALPDSLADIDFYFWREDYPTTRSREAIDTLAVHAIGAYLGGVLVKHLGGRWILRHDLLQSQVLVGSRVWLPFLRARHYMASRQSLLDCSLLGFYLGARAYCAR